MTPKKQSDDLLAAVERMSKSEGEGSVVKFEDASQLVLNWLDYFITEISNHHCDELLASCRAALIEAAGCLSLGLVRPAIVALRLQYELFIAWIYFNDHSVEWESVTNGTVDFPLRKQNINYVSSYFPKFKSRLAMLDGCAHRSEAEPYRTLSKFVHGSDLQAMPNFEDLPSMVQDVAAIEACVQLQREVSEYLSDFAAAWLADKWHDLPNTVKADINGRLGPQGLKAFCK
ncbi:hypothetical protein ACWPM1_04210 [Tsuneonella sp. HG249]